VRPGSTAPWPRTATFRGEVLGGVGGVAVEDLAGAFGTPLYVLDAAELLGRMRAYRSAFGPGTDVVYAAKALCVTGVLQLAAAEGLGVDVASGGELATALRARVPVERIWFHGNNKSDEELAAAVDAGVGHVVVDGFEELERVAALGTARGAAVGGRVGRPVGIALRVTPGVEARTHDAIATGQDDSKFGFTLSAGLAHRAAARALELDGVRLRALHCHVGSQVGTADAFTVAADRMVGLMADVRDRHGMVLGELNLGGGLGIAYTGEDAEPDVAAYARAVRATVEAACGARDLPVPRLAVEPGRSLVGPAGITLYRVGAVKEVPGIRTYVSVDGGLSDNPRPALYDARYTFAAAGGAPRGPAAPRPVTVVGKHCESGDVLARDVALPGDLGPGDLLAVAATGAYNHAMASNYNRLARPAMVLVDDGRARVLVRRETLDDVLARDEPLPDPS